MSFFSRPQPQPQEGPVAGVLAGGQPEAQVIVPRGHDDVDDRKLSSYTELKVSLHQQLLDMINLSVIDKMPPAEFRAQMGEMVRELLARENRPLNRQEQAQLVDDVLDELLGLGPLEPLLKDASVTDILVNCHSNVFVERGGQLHPTAVRFKDDRHLLRIIGRIVSAVGRRVDESQPMVDARLADGSRVNAIIPPLAVDGPLLSIRKFAKERIDMEKLIQIGSVPQSVADLLVGIVRARRNVLISGGTGSGKTTMLNAMSAYIDGRERIITIEDAAELQMQQVHVARLETRPANIEGRGEVTQRELVKNALRMRPDRIIVGEVRGGEAFDMLQAMNTGHEGSMTTVHANTGRDALARVEQMIGMTGFDLPTRSMRAQIASALHVVIQLERMSDGKRRLVSLQEITGMEGDVVSMQEIFRFRRESTDASGTIHGHYVTTGIRPKFVSEFVARGIEVPDRIFDPNHVLE
ncbi:CpaF family protein [Pelagibius marinus]|uniref:CpaF family protein n=1 Tax=Pelagibius marinus TaxID=2762760 RepID=UPI001872D643|nr:CpaF family protein [Pelagibius marinus]